MTCTSMQNYADSFMKNYKTDPNSRYRSYDHINSIYLDHRKCGAPTHDYVALHLFAFLGSWGMVCRGAAIMQKDYRFLIPVIEILDDKAYDALYDLDLTDEGLNKKWYIETVCDVIRKLKDYFYKQKYYKTSGEESKWGNVSDTLIGKILMATLGCIPAYDSYDIAAMKKEGICGTLGKKSLCQLVKYSKSKASCLKGIQTDVNKIVNTKGSYPALKYPIAKILDMIFWECGYALILSKY